jgi:hypothetical protein
MEFELVLNVTVDKTTFYWDCDPSERIAVVEEMIRNAIWDMDNSKLINIEVSEI